MKTEGNAWVVRCENGYEETFVSEAEARQWAWWGHCCTATHEITQKRSVLRNFKRQPGGRQGVEFDARSP